MAQNRYGVIAAVNNREHSPFKDHKRERLPGRDSGLRKMPRGGLPLDACSFDNAKEATYRLWEVIKENQRNNPERKYSGFNLVIADPKGAWVITNAKAGDITINNETRLEYEDIEDFSLALWQIPVGCASLLGGYDLNDFERSVRTQNHLPAIRELALPKFGDFSSWHSWLNQMAYINEYKDDPFGKSICQPNPLLPKTLDAGIPEWTTIGTHLMLVDEKRSSWYGLEGQLVHGRLDMQVINRNHPDSWAQVIFSEEALRAFPGRRASALAV